MKKYKAGKCKLGQLIKDRCMTQRDFATKTGFSYQYINDMCNRGSKLTMDNAMTISKALNVNIEDLYEWEEIDIN